MKEINFQVNNLAVIYIFILTQESGALEKDVGQVCVMRSSMKGVRSQDAQQFVMYIIPTVIKHTSMFLDGPPSPGEPKF